MFKGHFLVADMDGTLTSTPSKAHGHYLPLSMSPCLTPLTTFLQRGGDVCVVSTAGRRMWPQIFDILRPALFSSPANGRLFICGFSGAALFVSNFQKQTMEEDVNYRHTALNGNTTMLPPEHLDQIHLVAQRSVLKSYQRMLDDPAFLQTLSRKYHAPLTSLFADIAQRGETLYNSDLLSLKHMQEHGRYMKETGDALLDVQVVPNADGSISDDSPAVQITALAIPMRHAAEIFTDDVLTELAALGVKAKFQPNSVVIARGGLDKATCVRYLATTYGLDLNKAIAFGDIPQTIDRPLTQFPPMPFVSVSLTPELDPPGTFHAGGEEPGTAAFLEGWLRHVDGVSAAGANDGVDVSSSSSWYASSTIQRLAAEANVAWQRQSSSSQGSLDVSSASIGDTKAAL